MGMNQNSINVPVNVGVNISVNGEDKLKSISSTLNRITKESDLGKYWKNQTELIKQTAQAYHEFSSNMGDKKAGAELIKNFNALKAVVQSFGDSIENISIDGIDTSKLKNIVNMAEKAVPEIAIAYSSDTFANLFSDLALLEQQGMDVTAVLKNIGQNNSGVSQLQAAFSKVNQELEDTKEKLRESEASLESFISGAGINNLKEQYIEAREEVERLTEEIDRARQIAVNEFKQFLKANDLNDSEYGSFSYIFDEIRDGTMTAKDAIYEIKTEFSHLLDGGLNIDATQLQNFISLLENSCNQISEMREQIDVLSKQIATIGEKGALAGLTKSLAESEELTEAQREGMVKLLSDANNLDSVTQILTSIIRSTAEADQAMDTLYDSMSRFVQAISELSNTDFANLESISSIFKSVSNMKDFDVSTSSLKALFDTIEKLNGLTSTGSLQLFSGLNFDGFNDLHVSKSSVEHLISLVNSLDGKNLNDLVSLSNLNFNWAKELKVSKASIDNLIAFFNALSVLDLSGIPNLAGINLDTFNNLDIKKASVTNLKDLIENLQRLANENLKDKLPQINLNGIIGNIDGESQQLSILLQTIKDITSAVEAKTQAFENEGSTVKKVVDDELTALGTLWATIDDIITDIKNLTSTFSSTGISNDLVNNLKGLEGINLTQLNSLKNLCLSDVFDINTNTKSFTNLVNGLRDLSTINFTELAKLKGLDLNALGNLKNIGKSTGDLLSKESSSFINVQLKQIDSALSRYREAGLSEDALSDLKNLRSMLTSGFTVSGLLEMDDVNAEMKTFVDMLSEAMNKADTLAANLKLSKDTTEQTTKKASAYEALLNKEEKLLKKRIKNGTLDNKDTLELESIQAQRRAIEKQYKNEESFQALLKKRKAVYSDLKKDYDDTLSSMSKKAETALSGKAAEDFIDPTAFNNVRNIADEIVELQNKFKANGQLIDADLERAAELSEQLALNIKNLQPKHTNKGTYLGTLSGVKDTADAIEKMKSMLSADALSKGLKINFGQPTADGKKLAYTLQTVDGTIKEMSASWDSATGHITTYMNREKQYISQGKQLINSFKGKFVELTRYVTLMDILQRVREFATKGMQAVLELNTAMAELKKVTDETSDSYSKFTKQASDIAFEVGGKPTEVIRATADFARVGNDLEKSAKLAKDAITLKNVSEFENIEDATDSLISMTQAYKDIDSGEIVDVMNNIGNNFAISTNELSTALQKSASALTTGGNDLYEAAALITAGNTILQDADSVAAGMKVISMRITGTSAEALTELGEDTDGLVATVSKLQENVKMLTSVNGGEGISLLDDNGNYRSTYEILQDIADIYDDIVAADKADGKNRANALLEMLAGKNRSNVLASILQNPDVLRNAFESAQNSAGSALNELNTHLESIQGHLDRFSAAFQTLWNNAINTDVLNFFIDLGTKILKLVDNFGMIETAVTAIASILSLKGVGRANKIQLSLI